MQHTEDDSVEPTEFYNDNSVATVTIPARDVWLVSVMLGARAWCSSQGLVLLRQGGSFMNGLATGFYSAYYTFDGHMPFMVPPVMLTVVQDALLGRPSMSEKAAQIITFSGAYAAAIAFAKPEVYGQRSSQIAACFMASLWNLSGLHVVTIVSAAIFQRFRRHLSFLG